MTSVPSRRRVSRPASRPSVTHGSGIGSQARADLRDLDQVVHQREAREARLVRGEGDAAQPAPPGPRPTGSGRPGAPRRARARAAPAGRAGGSPARAGAARAGSSVATGATTVPALVVEPVATRAERRRSWSASTRAGTGRSRAALRRRHTRRGVSKRDGDRRQAVRPGQVEPAAGVVRRRGRGCRRRWSARGAARPATIRSSRANASAEASRSWRPLPTTPRRASEETTSAAR